MRTSLRWLLLAAGLCVANCGPSRGFADTGTTGDGTNPNDVIDSGMQDDALDAVPDDAADSVAPTDTGVDDTVTDDSGTTDAGDSSRPAPVYVYAHTSSDLYQVDPMSFAISHVGAFSFPADGNDHQMTDIAITATGSIWGVTFDALYRVDSTTAACTLINPLGGGVMFNGLTFLPSAGGGAEQLVAATTTGEYYSIDTTSGATRLIGNYGGGYGSSGDIVSVAGAGTYATVLGGPLMSVEYLARIDPATGTATVIGPTGLYGTWGLGYWGGVVYGFTMSGDAVTIDVTTGTATPAHTGGPAWWGAGVTTHAPITHG